MVGVGGGIGEDIVGDGVDVCVDVDCLDKHPIPAIVNIKNIIESNILEIFIISIPS